MTWLKVWLRSLFLPVRTYRVDIWAELHWRDFERDAAIVSQALG